MARNEDETTNIVDIPQSPLADDLLGQSSYISALSNFIRHAQTPMTIAVQGEWGCGKTSLMNAIAGQVCQNYDRLCQLNTAEMQEPADEEPEPQQKGFRNCLGVWINTWQYSILKNDSEAQVAVIRGVARELSSQMDGLMGSSSVVKEAGRKLLSSISGIALTAAKVGASAAGINPLSLSGLDELVRTQENGSEYFRDKLRKSVAMYLEEYNKTHRRSRVDSIIFFIDDLDRLDPPVAVQVLSLLKNLFEVPKCIFMLAIDYEVVVQGLSSRFGVRTEANEREFRSFFDKIIQLNFRVPLESYRLDEFISTLLKKIKYLQNVKERDAIAVIKATQEFTLLSCGRNPRSIKRMFNTLSLTREIHRLHPTSLEEGNRGLFLQLLFGVVCLQAAYPRIYDELVKRPNLYDWLDSSDLSAEEGGEPPEVKSLDDEDISPTDFDLDAFARTDPWVKKRKSAVQKLLYSLFELVMQDKFSKQEKDPQTFSDLSQLRTTKDYLDQIIQTSRLTAVEEDNEETFTCATLEEFITHYSGKNTEEQTVQELRIFCRVINKVFNDALVLEFSEDRVLFRAFASQGRLSKIVATVQVLPKGLVIRAGRSHRLGVSPTNEMRSMKLTNLVRHVKEFEERDINPIKTRFKEVTGVQRVPSRWEKVLQDELEQKDSSNEPEQENVVVENSEENHEELNKTAENCPEPVGGSETSDRA